MHPAKHKLSDLAQIRGGHPFRTALPDRPADWDYHVVQLRDVRADQPIDLDALARVKLPAGSEPQVLRPGDILMRARGERFQAALFTRDADKVLAAAQFFVISPDPRRIESAWLCRLLNQPASQAWLQRRASGSNIAMIGKPVLAEMPIRLPALATQRKIAALHNSWLKEKALTLQLLQNRERMVRALCQQYSNRDLT